MSSFPRRSYVMRLRSRTTFKTYVRYARVHAWWRSGRLALGGWRWVVGAIVSYPIVSRRIVSTIVLSCCSCLEGWTCVLFSFLINVPINKVLGKGRAGRVVKLS